MTSFKRCDRCGGFYVGDTIWPQKYTIEITKFFNGPYYLDICPNCYSELEQWLNEKKGK